MGSGCLLKKIALRGVGMIVLALSGAAYANPEGGQVVAGSASIEANGKKLDIRQQTHNAVIDWRSFDIGVTEHTEFHQPSSSATALNRVNNTDPSRILGTLTANGNVLLINPNGVFFGKDSKVDVNGLIATTADIDNQDFMAGALHFNRLGSPGAAIVNAGRITAKEAGLVALVAPNVANHGVISARLGRVALASGDSFIIDLYGDGLYELKVSDEVVSQLVSNAGSINAEGGTIALTAAAGREIVNSLITVAGELKAPTIQKKGGTIIIAAEGSNAVVGNKTADKGKKSGQGNIELVETKLDVSGLDADEKGGRITLTADGITLGDGTVLDARGHSGGGNIHVGGEYQGLGNTPAAQRTEVARNVLLDVSAEQTGDAGTAIIWSDGNTYFLGTALAQGGAHSGNGGLVEVSGKRYLRYNGYVNTLAENGETGLLLLDPADIVILDGSGDGDDADGSTGATGATVAGGDATPTQIYESELEGIASGTAISLTSTNSITINDLSDNTLSLDQSVTFSTGGGGFTMNSGDTISTTGTNTINITTTGGASTIGSLAGNGTKTLNIGGTADVLGVISGTGALTKTGAGTLTLSGNNTYSGTTTLTAGTLVAGTDTALGTGTISLNTGTLSSGSSARTLANVITLTQSSTIGGSADLTLNGTFTNTNNRTLTVNNTGLTTLAGTVNLSNSATNRTLTVAGTGNTVVSGTVQNGGTSTASALAKTGTGTLTLSGNNTYGGTTTVTAGTLIVGSDTALGTGTLSLNGGTIQGDGTPKTLANTVSHAVSSTIGGSSDLTFNGAFSSGNLTLTNNNSGQTTFAGTTTLTSNFTLAGSGNTTFSGAFGNFNGNRTLTFTNTGNTLISGTVNLSNSATDRSITFSGSEDVTVTGTIANGSTSTASLLTKTGAGTLTLSGNNTYGGTTTLTAGTIIVGSDTALGTGTLSLNGGTLSGDGTARTLSNAITLAASSTIGGSSDLTLKPIPLT